MPLQRGRRQPCRFLAALSGNGNPPRLHAVVTSSSTTASGCRARSTAIGFVMEYQGMGFVDAVRNWPVRAGMTVAGKRRRSFSDESQARPAPDRGHGAPPPTTKAQLKASPRHRILQNGAFPAKWPLASASVTPDGWQNLEAVFADYNADELKVAGLVIESKPAAATTVSATG